MNTNHAPSTPHTRFGHTAGTSTPHRPTNRAPTGVTIAGGDDRDRYEHRPGERVARVQGRAAGDAGADGAGGVRRGGAERAGGGERDGALPRAPRVQGRREVP